jgi:ribosomal protein S18 acetylase RimI-like enzyme/predicted enzyme related to lactoylglutathione lyase
MAEYRFKTAKANGEEPSVQYRPAELADVPAMARLRAETWGTEEYWCARIAAYLRGELHPQHALAPRVAFVAQRGGKIVGLIAGHLTRRHNCDGELEFIDVTREHRGGGIADGLLRQLAEWFIAQNANRICVDVAPENTRAVRFYARNGAAQLNKHWMVWEDIARRRAMPENPVTFEGHTPIISVRDVPKSVDFYVNVLGFTKNWGDQDFASVSRGKACLFLCSDEQGQPGVWVWIGVSDADALFAEYTAKGAKVRNPPQNFAWAYEFQIEDPDGNVLRLGSEPKEPKFGGVWLRDDGSRWRQLDWGKWEPVK